MVVQNNNIMHMNTGDGETSYAKNSGLQRVVIARTLQVLDDTLEEMLNDPYFGINTKCYKIVDLGSSSGPNSLWAMAHIADKIEDLSKHNKTIEFELFFNDLPGNDFNNLLKSVPILYGDENGKRMGDRFAYGLPGSFYGRLFARKSLHFAYSSYALHWLSQVPEGLQSKNKENINLTIQSSPKVFEAYSKQFQSNFSTFLKLRGEEIIEGGRMVLTILGRSFEDPYSYDDNAYYTLLGESFADMVEEGLVRLEDLYSFNLPFYAPCKQEIEVIVRNEGSFALDKIRDFAIGWDVHINGNQGQENPTDFNKHKSGKLVADCIRALVEPMITSHFGSSILDGLFQRYAKKVADLFSREKPTYFTLVISLTKRSD